MAGLPYTLLEDADRVVVLTHEFAPFRGGAATYAEEIAHAAHQQGLPIEVWAPRNAEREGFDFPVKPLGFEGRLAPWHIAQFAWEITRREKLLQRALVHIASMGAHIAWMNLLAIERCQNLSYVCTFHDVEPHRFMRNLWLHPLAKTHVKNAARIAAASPCAAREYQSSYLASHSLPPVVAPCAVRHFLADAPIPQSKPPKDGSFHILTLARIHPRKGQMEAAHALALLPDELRKKVHWHIVGVGDEAYLNGVRELCDQSGLRYTVHGGVPQDQLADTYAACHCYLLTSVTMPNSLEGFGMTYLEASLFGKPVVGYRSGGVADAVLDGQTGLLAEEGDRAGIAKAIERLMRQPELAARLGEQGKAHARSHSWVESARILYEQL